jgi:putative redox protein
VGAYVRGEMLTARAIRRAAGLAHEVNVNDRHILITDEPESLGGTDIGPAPHELLPAALASCISTTMAMYADRRDWSLGDITVEVEYDNESSPRGFEVRIEVSGELTDGQRRRLDRVAASCPLRRALEAGFVFTEHPLGDRVPTGAAS